MTKFFTYITEDGDLFDADFKTAEEAQKWADDAFAESLIEEGGMRFDECFEQEIAIIEYYYDGDGERIITGSTKSTVNYEHSRPYI